MILTVTKDFLSHRQGKSEIYNQRGRSDRVFLMNLDAEIMEHYMIDKGIWEEHESWMVDGIVPGIGNVDVKFIRKYWNVSREKTLNLIKQRNILQGYLFMEWVTKPSRPLVEGDIVEVRTVGYVSYDNVADNLRKSFKEPDGFYVDVRALLESLDVAA